MPAGGAKVRVQQTDFRNRRRGRRQRFGEQQRHRALANEPLSERPTNDQVVRRTGFRKGGRLPAATCTQEGEAVDQRPEPRQCLDVVIACNGNDFDAPVKKPPYAFLEGHHRLEPGIGTLNDIAREKDRIYLLLDREINGRPQRCGGCQVAWIDSPVRDLVGQS